jgi:hypothetical protein
VISSDLKNYVEVVVKLALFFSCNQGFEGFLNTQRESLRDISAELSEEQQLVLESIVPEIIEIAKKDTVITVYYWTYSTKNDLKTE